MLNNNGDTLLQITFVWGITLIIYLFHLILSKKMQRLKLYENKKLSFKKKFKNLIIILFLAIYELLIWNFAIIFYLMNSFKISFYTWTNLRFSTLSSSYFGTLNFFVSVIFKTLQILSFFIFWKIIYSLQKFSKINFVPNKYY